MLLFTHSLLLRLLLELGLGLAIRFLSFVENYNLLKIHTSLLILLSLIYIFKMLKGLV